MEKESLEMLAVLLSFIVIVPASALCFFPMKNQLRFGLRQTLLDMMVFFAVSISVVSWLGLQFSFSPNLLLFPLTALCFFAYHMHLRVHISKSLAVFSSVTALMSILGMYAAGYDALVNPSLGADSYTIAYALFQLGLESAAVLILFIPLTRYGSRIIDRLNLPRVWLWMLPFSALIIISNISIRPLKYETLFINRIFTAMLRITSAFLVLYFLVHIAFYFIVMTILDAAEAREAKSLYELCESQFAIQQRYLDATARERHDFRQSIHVLRDLVDTGKYAAAAEYLRQYEQSQPMNDVQAFCSNNALNALLNHYVHMAIRAGIETQIEAQIETQPSDALSISDVDLCRTVGNLFENAITGAAKAEEKWICMSIRILGRSMLYIVVTNSFDGKVQKKGDTYLSLKSGGHGVGLHSVKTIAESYGGLTEFNHEGQEFYSNVAIPLQNKQGKDS